MSNQKNAPKKKLQLDRTRLRTLDRAQLDQVVGGLAITNFTRDCITVACD